jgi:nucleotide-binding universal stress UspA family protein
MYNKVVVPLDGSKLAECVLSHVEALAKKEVLLVSVTERVKGAVFFPEDGNIVHDRAGKVSVTVGKMEQQAEKYLNRLGKKLANKGIAVRTKVLLGNPAEEITHFAADEKADLIVLATHGKSGPSRWSMGSIADKVSRVSPIPVLLVRSPGCAIDI